MKRLFTAILFVILGCAVCRELHVLDPKSKKCFDTYEDIQPINLSNLTKTCIEPIPEFDNCQGLSLITDEVIILECNEAKEESEPLKKGCYKIYKQDSSEDVVCQRYLRRNMCEIIKTPANLVIEVYCNRSARGIVQVRQLKIF